MTDYLNMEEKVVVANSKVESVKKELIEALHVEKALVVQKDEEIQAALLKTDVERENHPEIQVVRWVLRSSVYPVLQRVWASASVDNEASQLAHGLLQFRL